MARIMLTILSDLFDEPEQQASVRANLPVRTLISEARSEFNLPEDGLYSLRIEASGKVLDPDKTLEQQGVQTGALLRFNRERRAAVREVVAGGGISRQVLTGPNRPFLREDLTGRIFEIMFQPAIIGRPDPTNPQSSEMLAVDLGNHEGAKSVSRYHARIIEERGQFFLESIADHNPAYLNGSIVRVGDRRLLQPGDKIVVGKVSLSFGLRGQTIQRGAPGAQSMVNAATVVDSELPC